MNNAVHRNCAGKRVVFLQESRDNNGIDDLFIVALETANEAQPRRYCRSQQFSTSVRVLSNIDQTGDQHKAKSGLLFMVARRRFSLALVKLLGKIVTCKRIGKKRATQTFAKVSPAWK